MTESTKKQLKKLSSTRKGSSFSVDELQGLLLQISFAIMMVFMIAYFMFKAESKQKQQEQVLEIERQKLAQAVDTVNAEYRARYGLNILLPQSSEEGFKVTDVISSGTLTDAPIVRRAFSDGAVNGTEDFAEPLALRRAWINRVSEVAELPLETLSPQNTEWLNAGADASLEKLNTDLKTVTYGCASELQKYWLKNPSAISDPAVADILKRFNDSSDEARLLLVTDLSDALRKYSFSILAKAAGHDVLQ